MPAIRGGYASNQDANYDISLSKQIKKITQVCQLLWRVKEIIESSQRIHCVTSLL